MVRVTVSGGSTGGGRESVVGRIHNSWVLSQQWKSDGVMDDESGEHREDNVTDAQRSEL